MSAKQIHLLTLILWLVDVPLMVGDKFHDIGMPGWLSAAWPAIFFFAGILDKGLRIYFAPDIPSTLPPVPVTSQNPTP